MGFHNNMSRSFLNIHIFSSLEKPFCYRIVCHTANTDGRPCFSRAQTQRCFSLQSDPKSWSHSWALWVSCQVSVCTAAPPGWHQGLPTHKTGWGAFLPTTCRTVTSEHSCTRSKATGSPKHTAHFQGQRQTGQNK